jgi:hypothetical protein
VSIPLILTGTATVNVDYTTEFTDKGLVTTVAGGNGYGIRVQVSNKILRFQVLLI